jgi:LysM repeat protein
MDLKALIAKMDQIESKKFLTESTEVVSQEVSSNVENIVIAEETVSISKTLLREFGYDINEAKTPEDYKRAQQMMANLEKAAQYTGEDEIVRSRMGLPPKLPPFDQWDGAMPAPTGKPDWVSKLTGGFKLDKDAQGNVTGVTSNATSSQAGAVQQNKDLERDAAMDKELDAASAEADALQKQAAMDKELDAASAEMDALKKNAGVATAAAPSGAAAKPAGSSEYAIKPGDTLNKIAQSNGTTVDAIMKANPQIKDPNKISAGAKLNLPSKDGAAPATAPAAGGAPDPAKVARFKELLGKLAG